MTAPAKPAAASHICPYDSRSELRPLAKDRISGSDIYYESWHRWSCGDDGWLCDRCKEDRADRRAFVDVWVVVDADSDRPRLSAFGPFANASDANTFADLRLVDAGTESRQFTVRRLERPEQP